MASHSNLIVILLITISSLQLLHVSSFEFQVGDTSGWVVPPANDSKVYNDWASENRFKIDDTIRFKYIKDSVMEVTEEDYKRCNSTHPTFFANTGNTVFKLNHSGPFYFISGAAGHCKRGQRMIIKVISPEDSGGSRASVLSYGVLKLVSVQLALSFLCSSLF